MMENPGRCATPKPGDISKLKKKEMCSIAIRYFSTALEEKTKKGPLVDALTALVTARPEVLTSVVLDVALGAIAAAVAADDKEDEESEEEGHGSDGGAEDEA